MSRSFLLKVVLGVLASWRLMVVDVSAQTLTSGADFLKIDSGARSEGMGGAFTAIADDVNALTWNPAGVALLTRPQVGYLHLLYLSDIGYNFGGVAFPLAMGENTLGLGAGVVNLGTPSFDSTLGLVSPVSAGDNAFLLSIGYRVKDVFAFGITGKYILRNIAGFNASAFGGDAGVLITPGDRFRIGLGIFNVGQPVQFISAADNLPLTGRLGLAFKVLDIPQNSLTLSVDNAWEFGSSSYLGAAGMEYWFDKTFALRAGYTGDAYQQHWTAGTGFSVDSFEVDYAYAPMGTLGDTHRISLIVRFGGEGGESLLAPTGFTALAGDGFVSLKWKPTASSSVSGYNLYVRKPNATSLVRVTKSPIAASESSVRLNHLSNGQNYTFAVASVSPGGRESDKVLLSVVPVGSAPAAVALLAPTGLKAVLNLVGFDLNWDKALSPDVVGYNLYFADEKGQKGKKLNANPMTDTKVTLKKVDPTRVYRFLVTSVDKTGAESVGAPLSVNYTDLQKAAQAALLPPPAHLTLAVKEGKVYLNWDSAGADKKYNLYVSNDGKTFRLLTKTTPYTKNSAVLGPLKTDMPYTFGVTTLAPDGQESEKAVQVLPSNQ